MSYLSIILLSSTLVLNLCQDKSCDKIQIFHSYEDLYITYIAPLNCDDNQKNGPIDVVDTDSINKIISLLKKSELSNSTYTPDVRFKVIFNHKNEQKILCFGQPGETMTYSDTIYKYNDELCSYIIKIIESTGASKPQKVQPPSM